MVSWISEPSTVSIKPISTVVCNSLTPSIHSPSFKVTSPVSPYVANHFENPTSFGCDDGNCENPTTPQLQDKVLYSFLPQVVPIKNNTRGAPSASGGRCYFSEKHGTWETWNSLHFSDIWADDQRHQNVRTANVLPALEALHREVGQNPQTLIPNICIITGSRKNVPAEFHA